MIIPSPAKIDLNGKYFVLDKKASVCACKNLNIDLLNELWRGFYCGHTLSATSKCDDYIISCGNAKRHKLCDNDYAISIFADGFCIEGKNREGLLHGFMTFLQLGENCDEYGNIRIPCCEIEDKPNITVRAVHICIFPETTLLFLQKLLRMCALLKFSHVVLEFWGMYKYKCFPQLGWDSAFKSKQLLPVISEARELGLEIIPMFNHLGHASQSRASSGKHVVLDRYPELSYMFEPDGWTWNYGSDSVLKLLDSVRTELCDLCGNGSYFHLGCDEPYSLFLPENRGSEKLQDVAEKLNSFEKSLEKQGRRGIIWGDMLISSNGRNGYECNATDQHSADILTERLDRNIIVADWQYNIFQAPVETSIELSNLGFDVFSCPWNDTRNIAACSETIKKNNLFGAMYTTWHILGSKYPLLLYATENAWGTGDCSAFKHTVSATMAATLLRKVYSEHANYIDCGWIQRQIDF